jgi:hypothetical protein
MIYMPSSDLYFFNLQHVQHSYDFVNLIKYKFM